MKKVYSIFVVVFLCIGLTARDASAELPPKAKAMITILGYGTAGGALIGAASTAFGGSTRSIAQGASLGLYAGIIFGTYVLVTHHQRTTGYYDDRSSPYAQDSTDIYGEEYQPDEGGSSETSGGSGGFFDRMSTIREKFQSQDKKRGSTLPPLYLNILQVQF